jgi:DNA-binding CsgD family transcriptional regulator
VALLTGLAQRVRDAASALPLVVLVDDVDAADLSTMRLLGALPAVLADAPVLLLLAGRTGPGGPPPVSSGVGEDGFVDVKLGPLADDVIADLVRRVRAGDDADDAPESTTEATTIAAIVAVASGRPGVAVHVAEVSDPLQPLSALLTRVGPSAATLVVAAELAGGTVTLEALCEAIGASATEAAGLFEQGALRSPGTEQPDEPLLVAGGSWWVDAARSQLDEDTGVAAVARRVAPLVEVSGSPGRAAAVWRAAGDPERAAASHERAADAALAIHALATAAAELRCAIAAGGADQLDRLGHRAAELSLAAGDWDEADRLARELVPRLARQSVPERTSLYVVQYRARFFAGLADADDALEAALAEPAVESAARADALVLDAFRLVLANPSLALDRAEAALAIGTELGDRAVRATALGAAGLAHAVRGDNDLAEAQFRDALDEADAAGDPVVEARIAGNHAYALWRAGRPLDVERLARAELARLEARGVMWLGDQLALSRAVALFSLGRLAEVPEAIDAARRMAVTADARALLDLLDAETAILRGDLTAAAATVEAVAAMACAEDPTVVSELVLCRVELALARGDVSAAVDDARRGLEAVGAEDDLARARLLMLWWRAVSGAEGPGPVDVVTPQPTGAEVAALLAEADALRSGSEDMWTRAIDAWERVPGPLGAWRCRLDAAVLAGDLDAIGRAAVEAQSFGADGLASRADAAWRAAGGRRPPRRIEGPLTERELEVLGLVAQGSTNREVAVALAISHRTVAVHVDRCLTKLNASNRSGAVHEARRRGLLA